MNGPAPRPGGGFNPSMGMGQFSEEHMDENAMQQAMKQKALTQQAAAQTGPQQSSSSTPTSATTDPQQPTTGSDSFVDSILTKPLEDIATTLLSAVGLDKLLGLGGNTDSPEEKAKKQKTLQRYNQLNEEQQAIARQKYQEQLQKQKQAEQEAEQRRKIQEQRNQEFVMPTGKSDGAREGGTSGKQRAVTKLQQDRKTLGGPQSVG